MLRSTEKNNEINAIASGSILQGDLTSSSDVRIDGHLIGAVKTDGRLVLGEAGVIEGEVNCKNAIIAGELKATIVTEELLTLKSTAKLSGEIVSAQLAIEPGAVFSGKCSMGPVIKNINKTKSTTESDISEKTA
ncbi:MAG: cell shape determination protein CcmA [Flavobacteriales bacterium]|nr:cell shape determination protein CcmA [Flavobacteriales bacterium]|tara:strand:- start:87 stop:488 length:402 start_codon:yes stop_codon:yes gene_type:complete